ncbi:MAG: MotA/TolQ/ExbB proton channel family protein [Sphingomonas fennica]
MGGIGQLLMRLIDPLAFALVAGGGFGVALLRAPGGAAARAFAALPKIVTARPEEDAHAALMAAGRLEQMTAIRHIACADRLETAGPFLRRALRELAATPSADAFAAWGADDLGERARRHGQAIGFWRGFADAAPAMGMIGTVLGLVAMFAAMEDAAAIGPAMATALVATLYGLVVANCLAGPVADRLDALSAAELAWQARLVARFEGVARAELATAPAPVATPAPPAPQRMRSAA